MAKIPAAADIPVYGDDGTPMLIRIGQPGPWLAPSRNHERALAATPFPSAPGRDVTASDHKAA